MADNAVYTHPTAIHVVTYRDYLGDEKVISGTRGDLRADEDYVSEETASVVGRGNLLPSGTDRWYEVELKDGARHMVIAEGS